MDETNRLLELLKALFQQAPSLLTLLGCMVFAISRWKRHPKISLMMVVSLGLIFIHDIVFIVIYNWVPGLFIKPGNYDATVMRNVYLVLGLTSNITAAVAFAVLLGTIFTQRKSAPENI